MGQEMCSASYDGNDDGQVGITDLLGLLTVFGDVDTDGDGIWDSQDDCVDLLACNYSANPTEACKFIDACGLCGGPGEIYACGCFDLPDGDCDCEGNQLDAIGVCGGTCELDANLNGVCDDVEGCSDPEACNYVAGNIDPFTSYVGPCLQLDTHKVHTEGDLAGTITYRMYFHAPEEYPDYFVTAVYGGDGGDFLPLEISTSTTFFQHPLGSSVSSDIQALLFGSFPELEFDSWVTIGHAPELGPAPQSIAILAPPDQPWDLIFESGSDLIIDSSLGGFWYILWGSDSLGFPDSLGRVLLGQFTTDGEISASVSIAPIENWDFPRYEGLDSQSCTTSNLCIYPNQDGECDE